MNTGIQDAYNLGWKLAAVLEGTSDTLLDSYGSERIPVAEKILAGSSRGFASMFVLKGLRRFVRDHVIFPIVTQPAVISRLLAKTSQLDSAYPNSPLTVPGKGHGGPKPGDRAPDACGIGRRGQSLRLFDIMRGPHWTLVGFGAQTTGSLAALGNRQIGAVQELGSGQAEFPQALIGQAAQRIYRARPGTLVLIRPDGYIALRTTDPEVAANYLSWFIPPLRQPQPDRVSCT